MIEQAWQTFLSELPTLLPACRGQWAAYHGGERVGPISKNPDDLYRYCLEKYDEDQFLVICIEPGAGAPAFLPNLQFPSVYVDDGDSVFAVDGRVLGVELRGGQEERNCEQRVFHGTPSRNRSQPVLTSLLGRLPSIASCSRAASYLVATN
ncbi:MAG: hypothetical protein L0Y71_25705 [Gemmataceae bacterium]|nr:hypothetical protein [Gemmataceae bacterium]